MWEPAPAINSKKPALYEAHLHLVSGVQQQRISIGEAIPGTSYLVESFRRTRSSAASSKRLLRQIQPGRFDFCHPRSGPWASRDSLPGSGVIRNPTVQRCWYRSRTQNTTNISACNAGKTPPLLNSHQTLHERRHFMKRHNEIF